MAFAFFTPVSATATPSSFPDDLDRLATPASPLSAPQLVGLSIELIAERWLGR